MILKISPSGQQKLFSKTSQSKGKSYRLLLLVLPIVLWFGYKQVEKSFIKPQALLVLGGSTKDLEREKFAAKLARENPDLPIWVSSGSTNKTYVKRVFAKAGVDPSRLRLWSLPDKGPQNRDGSSDDGDGGLCRAVDLEVDGSG